jgi:hypothetical protein
VGLCQIDDNKILREIKSPNDEEKLQNDLDELQKWSDTWLLKFHPNKCKVLTVSNRKMAEKEANNYHLYDNEGKEVCTFSICSISPDLYGDQTAAAYSRCGLTMAWNRYLKLCSSRYVYVLLH